LIANKEINAGGAITGDVRIKGNLIVDGAINNFNPNPSDPGAVLGTYDFVIVGSGTVKLASADPTRRPDITINWLNDPIDRERFAVGFYNFLWPYVEGLRNTDYILSTVVPDNIREVVVGLRSGYGLSPVICLILSRFQTMHSQATVQPLPS
jgi:hypothetical protein